MLRDRFREKNVFKWSDYV